MLRLSHDCTKLVIGVLTTRTGGPYYGAVMNGILDAAKRGDAVVLAFETTLLKVFTAGQVLAGAWVDCWLAVNEFDDRSCSVNCGREDQPLVHLHSRPDVEGIGCCSPTTEVARVPSRNICSSTGIDGLRSPEI